MDSHPHHALVKSSNVSASSPRKLSNLTQRIITAVLMVPIVIFCGVMGGLWFTALVLILVALGLWEYDAMERHRSGRSHLVPSLGLGLALVLSVPLHEPLLWQIALIVSVMVTVLRYRRGVAVLEMLFSVVYVAVAGTLILALRNSQPLGLYWLVLMLAATWGTDSFAYLIGSKWGKTPLAPQLSPKKTIEGAIGGMIGAMVLMGIFLAPMPMVSWHFAPLLLFAPIFAILGDLFESALKRYYGVKDSCLPRFNPFPGHGGVLDRIDSLIWTACLFYVYLYLVGYLS